MPHPDELVRTAMWGWFGSGSVRLVWKPEALRQVAKSLKPDAKTVAKAIDAEWGDHRLDSVGSQRSVDSVADEQKSDGVWTAELKAAADQGQQVMGSLGDAAVQAFAIDLGLSFIPGLAQVKAIQQLLGSGFALGKSGYSRWSLGKTIHQAPLTRIGALSAASLLGACTQDVKAKALNFGTYAFAAGSAFLDPTGISRIAAPASRLALKLAWLKAEWERVQLVNTMFAEPHRFDIGILDICPYLGCLLLHNIETSDLIRGIDLLDPQGIDGARVVARVRELAPAMKRASAICNDSPYMLQNHRGIIDDIITGPGQRVHMPRLFVVTQRLGSGDTQGRTSYAKGSIWHSETLDLTLRHVQRQEIRSLGGFATDFTFEVKSRIDVDVLGFDAVPGEVVWFVWPPDQAPEVITARLRQFMHAVDADDLVLHGKVADEVFEAQRDYTADDGEFIRAGALLDHTGGSDADDAIRGAALGAAKVVALLHDSPHAPTLRRCLH